MNKVIRFPKRTQEKGNANYLRALQKALGDSKPDSKKIWGLMRDKK